MGEPTRNDGKAPGARRKRRAVVFACAVASLLAALIVLTRPNPKALYTMTFLPSMGGVQTAAQAINDQGQVLATVRTAREGVRVLVWDKSETVREVDSFPKASHVSARLNNQCQIAGTAYNAGGTCRAFFWDADGIRHRLDPSAGKQVHVKALNNRGQVVGHYTVDRGPRHAFVWDATAGMQDLGTFGGTESLACDINDAGQVVGFVSRFPQWHAFLWDPNTGMRRLGPTKFGPAATCHVNNQGVVAGQFGSADDETCVSIWTDETGARRLPSVGGDWVQVRALNDAGRVLLAASHSGSWKLLGRRLLGRSESYLWDSEGGFRGLERHLGRRDVRGFTALDINEDGVMVGSLRLEKPYYSYGVLLEPLVDSENR